jgi:hypothetical protein
MVKFDFEPLNPKRPQWAPKWVKAPGEKFEFGSLPKSTNSPRVKFKFGPIKVVVGGMVAGSKKLAKAPEKYDFGGRQQCSVKDKDHFKGQCS